MATIVLTPSGLDARRTTHDTDTLPVIPTTQTLAEHLAQCATKLISDWPRYGHRMGEGGAFGEGVRSASTEGVAFGEGASS